MTDGEQKTVDRIHDYLYELLCEFDKICRKYQITYFLDAGTLIGAVRHHDFVPWDDDADIYMETEDYRKFLKHADELPDRYTLHVPSPEDKAFWDFTPHISDKRISMNQNAVRSEYDGTGKKVYYLLDIFTLENTFEGSRGAFQRFELKMLYGMTMAWRPKIYYGDYTLMQKAEVVILRNLGKLFSRKWIFRRYDRVSRRFSGYHRSDILYLSNAAASFLDQCIFRKEWYRSTTPVRIRNHTFPAAAGYDASLRKYYGDYMQLPPEENRVPGHLRDLGDITFLQPAGNPEAEDSFSQDEKKGNGGC